MGNIYCTGKVMYSSCLYHLQSAPLYSGMSNNILMNWGCAKYFKIRLFQIPCLSMKLHSYCESEHPICLKELIHFKLAWMAKFLKISHSVLEKSR